MRINKNVSTVIYNLGSLAIVIGILLFLPVFFALAIGESYIIKSFVSSGVIAIFIGIIFKLLFKSYPLKLRGSLLICGLGWILLCVFAALPFYLETDKNFLDCYFETVSGFTTTGITLFTDIEVLDKTIILWRSFIQWLGGLGIITFFLAISYKSQVGSYHLLSAESHKIDSLRLTPSVKRTAIILWGVYLGLTLLMVIILKILGLSFFDSFNHSMTALSTGGFSPYNSSIGHFQIAGYSNYRAIEYVTIFFMFLGGVNFVLHYKFLTLRFKSFFGNRELQIFILIIVVTTLLTFLNLFSRSKGFRDTEGMFRDSLFTVVSIVTTTGFGTRDIATDYFPSFSKQIFLILMVIGGSIGSTAGGIKVHRLVILFRLFGQQIKKVRLPRTALSLVRYQGKIVSLEEIQRIAGLFTGWLVFLIVGGLITSYFSNLDPWESFSGMFSAMGNIGPCFFTVQEMSELPPIVKITYIFGMLAGRLEILPMVLIFNPKAWKK
jgi:trk system potassium uptake protein